VNRVHGFSPLTFSLSFASYIPPLTYILKIDYSEKYNDGKFEYRHVTLPKEMSKDIPKNRTLSDGEWRRLGVQQSKGWEHYAVHRPEPWILLFRRPLGTVSDLRESYVYVQLITCVRRLRMPLPSFPN
jgi:cyclin-dependent kinase regulatory subunit CKS1